MANSELSHRFIDRPIFAGVLSLFVLIAGSISLFQLPISEYPEVVPPSVVVNAVYPGANPKVIAETVAAPLEEQINGVENMLYMSSQATTDGTMSITVTFRLGTDPDLAQQLVQNRVTQATPRLPDVVRSLGVTTIKSSPDLTMVVHLVSPDNRYDTLYLRNYALLNVRDKLARLAGIGQVEIFGAGDYAMRVWLNPQKMATRNIAAPDVIRAIREQNIQIAAGVIGAAPMDASVPFELPVNVQGRLKTAEEFGDIVIKSDAKGATTRLRDVARLELGASQYSLRSLLDNKPAVAIPIFQRPGANALEISTQVRETMNTLKANFPPGIDFSIVYDPTVFVRESINAVVHTLIEALLLVVLVVIVFLQTWRASIIPLLAVPISIIGTFAIMHLLGFSINALSLFGLVLAIGIVVDDAIVVVENVERNIRNGLAPRAATYQAMREVSGPIIAIALVLCVVFVPIAFISGLTGQFYKQFALTIAISTVISAFNSLTLSPALAAILLKDHTAPKDRFSRIMEKIFGIIFSATRWVLLALAIYVVGTLIGLVLLKLFPSDPHGPPHKAIIYWYIATSVLAGLVLLIGLVQMVLNALGLRKGEPGFTVFNHFFDGLSNRYSHFVGHSFLNKALLGILYIVALVLTVFLFRQVPGGYVPGQDKQYLVAFAQLPGGASIERTESVIRRMSDLALKQPGVQSSVAFPGLSIAGFSNSSNAGIVFVTLKPFEERTSPELSAGAIVGALNQKFQSIGDAYLAIFPPPPVQGLGTIGGFKLEVEDHADLGYDTLNNVVQQVLNKARQTPELNPYAAFTSFNLNVPQLDVDINRVRAKQQGVALPDLFDTLQVFLGSYYVNDFNLFGRTYRVYAEADAPFRAKPSDIGQLKVRNESGQMVPLGSLVNVAQTYGTDRAMRYNAFRAADINGDAAPGFSSGEAQAAISKILDETLPKGITYEWTDITYQQILAGNSAVLVFPLCVLFVFLVLAAQYESLSLPLAVILIVPMCLFGAIFGVWLSGHDNNIFTQIGFIVLVGLACKNAILIVEFARELEHQGKSIRDAALEAAHLRLRPILMTSFAFIMGVIPLITSTGAGAEMRRDMGIAVFSGMIGVTLFGLLLTPMFYVIIRTLATRGRPPVARAMHEE
ncbi:MAG: efflux RND transporter permease subunit [Rickettsiales bacterium]